MRRGMPLSVLVLWAALVPSTAAVTLPVLAAPPAELPVCDLPLQTPVPPPADLTEQAGLGTDTSERILLAPGSELTFEGCFTFFPAGPCRDVFRDTSGTLWICKDCFTTKNPPHGCTVLSGSGFWCV